MSELTVLLEGLTFPEGPRWRDNDQQDIPEPRNRNPILIWEAMERNFFDLVENSIDIEHHGRNFTGCPKQAANINSFDEVPNSSWFTNRHGLQQLTPEEITNGPVVGNGPDTSGPWIVFRPKVGGATPGFWIEDSHGDQYILKFDPSDHTELATAAAAMGSRYFHACGYYVPQETIVYWRPEILLLKAGEFP